MKQKEPQQLKQVKQQITGSRQSQQSEQLEVSVGHEVQINKLNTKKQQFNRQNRGVVYFIYLLKLLCLILVLFTVFGICYFFYMSLNSTNSTNPEIVNKTQPSGSLQNEKAMKKQELKLPQKTKIFEQLPSRQDNSNKIIEKLTQLQIQSKQNETKQAHTQAQINKSENLYALPEYSIQIKWFPQFTIDGESIDQYGIGKDIQVGSIYDYLNISESKQYLNFKQNWNKSIQYENYAFQHSQQIQSKPQILQFSSFNSSQEMQSELQKLNQWKGKRSQGSYLPLYLSCHLVWNSSKQLRQLQLYYLTNKYNLDTYKEQLPFCIFSTGYKIGSRERHKYLLQSIQNQNYTNYRLILVDDGSPDNTSQTIYDYLKQKKWKLNNRVKLIRNKRNLGATLSTYYWARSLCKQGQIIVHIDMDDMLIGNQVLKVLNSLYHNPNTWYVYTRYLRQDNPDMAPNSGKSRGPNFKVKSYKHIVDWRTSALRTLRYEVMKNIPVQSVIQYHYDKDSQLLFPKFYDTDADRFLIYPQLELSGDQRIRYIDDVFYYYNITYQVGKKCNMRHEHFDEYKSRIKKVFEPMKSLNDTDIRVSQTASRPTKQIIQNLKDRYKKYMNCLKQQNNGISTKNVSSNNAI